MTQPNELVETIEKALEAWDRNEDTHLQANMRSWLRALLEENKRIDGLYKKATEYSAQGLVDYAELESQLQQTREELSQVSTSLSLSRVDAKRWREELGQAKAELSAKDKVLEWYAYEDGDSSDGGDKARNILNLYPPRREEDET